MCKCSCVDVILNLDSVDERKHLVLAFLSQAYFTYSDFMLYPLSYKCHDFIFPAWLHKISFYTRSIKKPPYLFIEIEGG